VTITT